MHFSLATFVLSLSALSFHASVRGAAINCSASNKPPPAGKAVYFITNSDNATNNVIAIPISAADGTLAGGTSTNAGGNGAAMINATSNQPVLLDGLASQSSVAVVDNSLFTVNAGSNTAVMFAIDPADPTKLTMVGKPVELPGEFPNTIAASAKNKLVCVGMTGAAAGVSCAPFDATTGIGKMDALRKYDLGQSTPPAGPLNTVSQVFWSNDEQTLFATVKGDPTTNKTGFLSAFSVQAMPVKRDDLDACTFTGDDGADDDDNTNMDAAAGGSMMLSSQEVRSVINGTAVLFGSLPVPDSTDIFATDASFGAAILSVDGSGNGKLKSSQAIDGQKATCWVTISAATNSAFVTDVGTPRLVEMSLDNASILGQIDFSSSQALGAIDLKASGNFLYILAPGNSDRAKSRLIIIDVSPSSKGRIVQKFDIDSLAASQYSQGMVVV